MPFETSLATSGEMTHISSIAPTDLTYDDVRGASAGDMTNYLISHADDSEGLYQVYRTTYTGYDDISNLDYCKANACWILSEIGRGEGHISHLRENILPDWIYGMFSKEHTA